MKLRRSSLEYIILIPVAVFVLLAGTGSYFLILRSFDDFADRTIRQSLQSLSSGIYSLVDRGVDQLNRAGKTGNRKATRVRQVSTLIEIEDFVRKNEIGVVIYQDGNADPLLVSGVPTDAASAVPRGGGNRYQKITLSNGSYYASSFDFGPWNWQFVLFRHGQSYDELLLNTQYFYISTAIILLLIAGFFVLYLRRTIARPIHLIVARLRDGAKPDYHGIREFEFLSNSIGTMMDEVAEHRDHLEEQVSARTADLLEEKTRTEDANRKFLEQNKILTTVSGQLAKYISPQLYQAILSGGQEVKIESRRKKLTIFFSSIANFTEITDQLEAEELTDLLNQYLTEMSSIAQRHGANFDKFIGHSMMLYFGDPESNGVEEDAAACVRMAIAMQQRLRQLQASWRDYGLIDRAFEARIGINTGYCTVGNFGSNDRMDYTIVGGKVNLAAQLEARAEPGGILIASETYSLVKDWLQADEQEEITIEGIAKPVKTYSVTSIYADDVPRNRIIKRDIDGLSLNIDGHRLDQAGRRKAIEKLKQTLERLES